VYKNLTTGDIHMMTVWGCDIPLKVKIFIWMLAHDRIQSAVQLKKKKWSRSETCSTCDKIETSDHIIFQCPIVVFLLSFLRYTFGWSKSPTSYEEFLLEFVDNRRRKIQKVLLFICAGAMWTIWKTCNDLVFNKKVISTPMVVVYKTVMLIKTWRPLMMPKFSAMTDDKINLMSVNAH